jgi:transcriptional regulator with XRE-family HTH domain
MSGSDPISPHAAFGQVLRKHRLAAGLSQEQLSLESGVQRNFISLIETGQNQPTISTIFKLATAMGIKPSRLITETERIAE